jgi:hypothetical protein
MADGYITVVHKITNMVETVPVSYYEELKDVYRPITKKEQTQLDKASVDPEAPEPAVHTIPEPTDVGLAELEDEAQEGAK